MHFSNPYESPAVRAVTGVAIRPGGVAVTGRAADHCGLGPADRVLDVGCGTGATVDFLARHYGANVVGVDFSDALIRESRDQHPDAPLIRADAMGLPFKTARFSAVTCECVCSLLPDAVTALREFYRVLTPGGALVVADLYWRTPSESSIPSTTGLGGCLAGAVDQETLLRRIVSAGFSIDLWEDHTHALKQLAAEMVWAGVPLSTWWGAACGGGNCQDRRRAGYALVVAKKMETQIHWGLDRFPI